METKFDEELQELNMNAKEKIKTFVADYILKLIEGNKERKVKLKFENMKTRKLQDEADNLARANEKLEFERKLSTRIRDIIAERSKTRLEKLQLKVKKTDLEDPSAL